MMTNAYQSLRRTANIGRVRLVPSAISLHPDGPAAHDDVWLPILNADGTVKLENGATGHFFHLTPADVVAVEPDPRVPHDGLVHLRVTLRGRLGLQGLEAGWLDSR